MYVCSRYAKAGRGFWNSCKEGKIVITESEKGDNGRTEYIIKDGDVAEVIRWSDTKDKTTGKIVKEKTHTIYGVGSKTWKGKKLVEEEQYKPGTNQARIFRGEWKKEKGKIGGLYEGISTQKCYGGGFRKEIFTYGKTEKSKKIAYKVSYGSKKLNVVYPNGKPWLNIACFNEDKIKFAWKIHIVKLEGTASWRSGGEIKAKDYNYNEFTNQGNYEVELYDTKGKIECKGKVEGRQKVGEWIENYENKYYLLGVSVSKKLFFAKPEELDPKEVLQIENVQLRTSLMKKVGTEKILQKCDGKRIDIDGENELWELPMSGKRTQTTRFSRDGDSTLKLLKVKDPSTGTFYTLRVPPDSVKCEDARRWTLGFNLEQGKEIEFLAET